MSGQSAGGMHVLSAATLGCRLIVPRPLAASKPRRRRRKRSYECPDITAFVGRQLRGLVRRAAGGDLEAMSALKEISRLTGVALGDAARALNDPDGPAYSWEQIAAEYGSSKQNAIKRWANTKEQTA
ncbi:hypothetical protein P5P86_11850 [Nocardioides sp. BP30]|uniref:hypothetical protein n=1 Tax=Nocardioides sp. BP30 TaxID=3036374 RepID=UPI00246889B6|nr:hypothetical protein [Nocardioides sp. BP30]WGL50657.1 hypothetical protein P5P86_11850 [Nocardioides sp. BP30]